MNIGETKTQQDGCHISSKVEASMCYEIQLVLILVFIKPNIPLSWH